jgi:hypothetical protein
MLPRPNLQETVAALYGAWRLLLFDASGLRFLPDDIGATARSFYAAILCLPTYLLLEWLQPGTTAAEVAPLTRALPIDMISYVLQWVAYPVLLVNILAWMQKSARWALLVTTINWTGVVQWHLSVAASLVLMTNLLPEAATQVLGLLVVGVTLAYKTFAVRAVLAVSGWTAFGLVLVELAMLLVILQLSLGIARVG